jgi:hypothetical protein
MTQRRTYLAIITAAGLYAAVLIVIGAAAVFGVWLKTLQAPQNNSIRQWPDFDSRIICGPVECWFDNDANRYELLFRHGAGNVTENWPELFRRFWNSTLPMWPDCSEAMVYLGSAAEQSHALSFRAPGREILVVNWPGGIRYSVKIIDQ